MIAQAQLYGSIYGGVIGTQMKAMADLKQAELDNDKEVAAAKRKNIEDMAELERKKSAQEITANQYDSMKSELESALTEATDAATAKLQEKKITLNVELEKAAFDMFKERVQNAYDNSIYSQRFKEGRAQGIGAYQYMLAQQQFADKGVAMTTTPGGGVGVNPLGLPVMPMPNSAYGALGLGTLPAPAGTKGGVTTEKNGKVIVEIQLNNPLLDGRIIQLADQNMEIRFAKARQNMK